ncbi:MAG: hypothetical protein GW865_01375 [Candidatus Aenigmarchaeota archaeon]|nr:hypothetical protein [Candidatus Aenigmarchaeota archaeon]
MRTLYPGHILPEIFACFSFNGSVQCMRDAEDLVDSVLKMDYIPVEVEYDSSRLNGKHLSDFNRN